MLGLSMAGVGMLLWLIVIGILSFTAYRFLPLRRSRSTFWLGMTVLVPLACAGMPFFPSYAMQALAVIEMHGWDAYSEGLRVINKHGQLSDGSYISVFWAAAMGGGAFVLSGFCMIPLTTWCMHYHPGRKPHHGVLPAGVVHLDGAPVPGAEITFYIVVGDGSALPAGSRLNGGGKLRGYARIDADDAGRYECFALPPRTFRVTVTGVGVPPKYGDAGQTPLVFVWDFLGPVVQDLNLESRITNSTTSANTL